MMPSSTRWRPRSAERALRQRHQRQRAALAVVVGAQQDHDVFERDDDDQRPEDQRQDAEHRLARRRAAGADRGQHRLAKRVERAGADVAVDDADAAERQRPEAGCGRDAVAVRQRLAAVTRRCESWDCVAVAK